MNKINSLELEKKLEWQPFLFRYRYFFGYVALIFVGLFIIVARRPDALFNPQFWAEDGHFWYGQAYNEGIWRTIFRPENGYLQTISRLVGGVAQLLPLRHVPLFFNSMGMLIQTLPVLILWSSRFRKAVPSVAVRLTLSAIYLFLPNSFEENVNITNAHWHLALAVFMLIIVGFEFHSRWKIWLESLFLIIAGLSGPFSLALSPIAWIIWFRHKGRDALARAIVLSLAALCQTVLVISASSVSRSAAPLGANWYYLVNIVGEQVFGSGIFGHQFVGWASSHQYLSVAAFLIGLDLIIYAFVESKFEFKMFLLFSLTIFVASLISPQASFSDLGQANQSVPEWTALMRADTGIRYYFFPILAWLTTLTWYAANKNVFLKTIGCTLLLLATIGFVKDFRYNPYVNYNFADQVKEFDKLPKGTKYTFKINPENWTMVLVKH